MPGEIAAAGGHYLHRGPADGPRRSVHRLNRERNKPPTSSSPRRGWVPLAMALFRRSDCARMNAPGGRSPAIRTTSAPKREHAVQGVNGNVDSVARRRSVRERNASPMTRSNPPIKAPQGPSVYRPLLPADASMLRDAFEKPSRWFGALSAVSLGTA